MKARLRGLEFETFRLNRDDMPEILSRLEPEAEWDLHCDVLGRLRLNVRYESGELDAYDGDLILAVGDRLWVSHEDLFHLLAEFVEEPRLPDTVWVPQGKFMVQTALAELPEVVGRNQVTGAYIESREQPHGVKGFPLSFFPVEDAEREAKLIAPRVARVLGFDNLLGLTRLVVSEDELEPGCLARFWFTVCDDHGRALKEEK